VLNSFSIARARCAVLTGSALREEIRTHTGTEEEASSILRSLERFGGDASIRFYEMTPHVGNRMIRNARAVTWSVRALRD
jgi:hypothetical protein